MKKANDEHIIVFCAHPDDEAIGPGGTIAKYAQEGKKVIIVIFTDGESSHPWQKKEVIVKTRKKEAEKCAEILGAHALHHLRLRDGGLTQDIKKPIVNVLLMDYLKEYRPTKVFTHARDDALYPDHVAVHKAVTRAVDEYNAHVAKKSEQIQLFTFNIWAITVLKRNTPQLYIDITDTFEKKAQALQVFKSQSTALIQLWPTVIVKAILNGFKKDKKYAESFYRIR